MSVYQMFVLRHCEDEVRSKPEILMKWFASDFVLAMTAQYKYVK